MPADTTTSADAALHRLAEAAGLCVDWVDASGESRRVEPPTLRAVLESLELPARDERACGDSLERLRAHAGAPPMLTVDAGERLVPGGAPGTAFEFREADGRVHAGRLDADGALQAPGAIGYHSLHWGDTTTTVAVAPLRCFGMADACGEPEPRRWGVGLQAYSAHAPLDAGVGDAAGAAAWVERVAGFGGDAIALSPLHARRIDSGDFSPYAPGDRRFLEPLHAAPALVVGDGEAAAALDAAGLAAAFADADGGDLVDWPRAARLRWSWLRALHARAPQLPESLRDDFRTFVRDGGDALERYAAHAAREYARSAYGGGEDGPAVDDPVDLQCFAQWLAARSWAGVQSRARGDGMSVGLVADLAVGFDPAGAEAAAWPDAILRDLVLGAPPDAFNAAGQVWGIGGYSPQGLRDSGYAPWIELLRAVMRDRGGVRIDHILGLLRLWVVPAGGASADGVYLRQPFDDLLRLLALESWRQRAVVIGEDLGVVPEGFRDRMARRGVLGIDVLMFTRDRDGEFLRPGAWRREAIATTTTHDLPTLAGWRACRDLEWRARLEDGDDAAPSADARAERCDDVQRLQACVGAEQGGTGAATEDWLQFVSGSPSPLALLPLEDALGLREQPNLPGTTDGHPNWRRRLPEPLPEDTLGVRLRAFAGDRRRAVGVQPREDAA
jgi:4-alpha-glucanotransferase